jgi:adenylate cyclase
MSAYASSMADQRRGDQLSEELGRALTHRVPTANVIGAVLAFASGALTAANIHGNPGVGRSDVIAFVIYLAVSGAASSWYLGRRTKAALDWLIAEREAGPTDQRSTLALPMVIAITGLVSWSGAAIIWFGLSYVGHHSWRFSICLSLSILLGGVTTSGVSYLLAEWTMRPAAALALAGAPPTRRIGPGVHTKLLLSWLVGADVFLLMIGLAVLGRPSSQPPSRWAIFFIIGAGFAAGTFVLYVASRSLASPLIDLRAAVDRVTHGDLDVDLTVNDGGELGLVQAGFNQMVNGLKERRTLQDLFGRQVGEEVARLALRSGEITLGGERRDVAVVFVDVIGSTRLAQTRPPEEVVGLLNRFFGAVVSTVAEEGGWVNKFEGDGAMCVFGAPMSTDDYAERALRAARTLRRELLAVSMSEHELDAAIGVSAGTVVAGNVGAEQRFEYTVMGLPVNEAARLTSEAKQRLGRVLASEEVIRRAAGEASRWMVAGETTLRGYDEPILVYEPADSVRVTQDA